VKKKPRKSFDIVFNLSKDNLLVKTVAHTLIKLGNKNLPSKFDLNMTVS